MDLMISEWVIVTTIGVTIGVVLSTLPTYIARKHKKVDVVPKQQPYNFKDICTQLMGMGSDARFKFLRLLFKEIEVAELQKIRELIKSTIFLKNKHHDRIGNTTRKDNTSSGSGTSTKDGSLPNY